MLPHRFYYTLKPYVPWRVRMAARRVSARHKRQKHRDTWPIDETAGRTPEGWPGWPEAKQFAFVITHDVEGPEGLEKCRRLAELEMKLGLRSSFNFIPEGPYTVPPSLRSWLVDHGFEVGVHDLHHDGKLYRSREGFRQKARRINSYLRGWNATGFRSGFMLRNLAWLHDLHLGYDSSTFDTDPFEPQSEGARTIFPFWIPAPDGAGPVPALSRDPFDLGAEARGARRQGQGAEGKAQSAKREAQGVDSAASNEADPGTWDLGPGTSCPRSLGGGYIEIPYTLPQDSTLFLVLREQTPDIWLRKLDWIAAHGGMALVNVHPDYLRFEDERASPQTFPVAHYLRLLDHVRQHYASSMWQALPGEVATHVENMSPRLVNRTPRRICMVTHSYYESDNRVSRYAEALAARGDHVDVFSLRGSPDLGRHERMNGVDVHRIQDRFGKTERTKASYLSNWLRFLGKSSWRITRHHAAERYDLVHVHNLPDLLVFAAWLPRLTGARMILDIHDIVPEFYASKFGGGRRKIAPAVLRWVERRSARFADWIIISNHLWFDKYATRTGTADRCSVFINNVNTRVFQPRRRERADGKAIILFPGGLQWHQGVDIALRAFKQVAAALPHAEFHIYGQGNMKPALVALASELGFNGQVKFFDAVPVAKIAPIMAGADLGVVPKRADSFGNEAYSTKIMEFMSVGVPVVVSSTKVDRFYFDDTVVRFFESGNPAAMADAMIEVLRNEPLRRQLIANALDYSRRNSWETRKADYLHLVDSLCDGKKTLSLGHGPDSDFAAEDHGEHQEGAGSK